MAMHEKENNFKKIELERTICFGWCPVYKVTIHHTGKVVYNGERHVEQEGVHEWSISEETVEEINMAIEKVKYFRLKKKVPNVHCTDMPSCITTIEMQDGQKRTIDHYLQTPGEWPPRLTRFEEKVDELIGVSKYVGDYEGKLLRE
jgi:hypothetical protein